MTQKISIYGSGLVGCLLANELVNYKKQISAKYEVRILESRNEILPSFQSVKIKDYYVNAGFHGLEFPRAASTAKMIQSITGSNALCEVPARRILAIGNTLIPYEASLKNWPKNLSFGLDQYLDALNQKIKSYGTSSVLKDPGTATNLLAKTPLWDYLSICYRRYADSVENSLTFFMPWFFPSEFPFCYEDEGVIFQRRARSKLVRRTYLIPKGGLFNNLREPIENGLKLNEVDIFKNSVDLEMTRSYEKDNLKIWTAGIPSLLKQVYPELVTTNSIKGCRSVLLGLFKCSKKGLDSLLGKNNHLGTEILCLNREMPSLSRLSFPAITAINPLLRDCSDVALILAEFWSYNEELLLNLDLAADIISNVLSFNVTPIGFSEPREFPIFHHDEEIQMLSITNEHIDKINMLAPDSLYGARNMAKASSDVNTIMENIIQKLQSE